MIDSSVTRFDPGFEHRTVGTLLRAQAQRLGERPWALFEHEQLTFAEADRRVDAYVGALIALGVTPDDRVGLLLANSPEFLLLALAAGRLGAIFVPLNLALRGETLAHPLRQSGVSVLAVEPEMLERVAPLAADLPALRTLLVREPIPASAARGVEVIGLSALTRGAPDPERPEGAATLDPWSVMFTSGTTGAAKGAVMSHQYWYLVPAELAGAARDVRADDVFYVSSPMFHAAAWLVQIFPALMLGLPVAIDDGFSASAFWDRVRRFGATQLLTMGATHIWLWNQEPDAADIDNPARVWAPIPIPGELHEPFKQRFGIEHLWFSYGGTEFMSVTNTDVRRPLVAGSSGRARPSVQLAVHDDYGRPMPDGEVGELCVRPLAPHAIFGGYYGMPETTVERFRDLWYHTGDLVRIDEDGELFFVDRKDDYLRVHGENVASFDVETALGRHEAVAEVAAYGVQSEESALVAEDEIMVAIVLQEGAQIEVGELLAYAAEELPRFALPVYVEFVADLPRTPSGRVQKHLLRERGTTTETFRRDRSGAIARC